MENPEDNKTFEELNKMSVAFVANFLSNNVTTIDTKNHSVISTISVINAPRAIGITSDNKIAYVLGGGGVSVIDIGTLQVIATILGITPTAIVFTPDNQTAYVLNFMQNTEGTVSVIDIKTHSVIATIPVGIAAVDLVLPPNGKHVYVANTNSDNLTVIDTKNHSVVATISVNLSFSTIPLKIIVATQDGKYVYVVGEQGMLIVIDTKNHSVVATIFLPAIRILINSPDSHFIYAASNSNLFVVDTKSHSLFSTIPVPGSHQSITITPDGKYVYIPNITLDSVSVIDTKTNALIARVEAGDQPRTIRSTSDGKSIYVSNIGNPDTVSIIDVKTQTKISTISVGIQPVAIVFTSN
ncbi:cytochrome D1 domain-containing protein [Bacillus sp. SM2101]|uniref:cytochrome D1 domain-containing protein n=1 Tax=Bacillus sp. SM2101 TaxID=2805366 RepID=UPI001BDE5D97|nr:cytochrome D1 domain-containing protein [Bacillus sp. SM2101]